MNPAPLYELPRSATVLDLACGVGEPALTLTAQRPDLRLFGIDTSGVQVETARARAVLGERTNVRFAIMSMDALELDTGSMSAVLSRMGVLMMGDPRRTAAEAARVLAPGGIFTIAVWAGLAEHPAMNLGLRALRAVLPADRMPDLSVLDDLAANGVRDGMLRAAGMSAVSSRRSTWTYPCADFERWWSFVLAIPGPMQDAFRSLDADAVARARIAMAEFAAPFRKPAGNYLFPVACQLLTGIR